MVSYRGWYYRRNYVTVTVRREDYELLKELCRDESIVDCVHRLLIMVSQKREVEVKISTPTSSPPTKANPSSKASSSPPTGSKVLTSSPPWKGRGFPS